MTPAVRVDPFHHRSSRKKNGHYPLYDASSSRPPLYKYSLYTPGIGLDRDTNTGFALHAQPEVTTLLSALQLVRLSDVFPPEHHCSVRAGKGARALPLPLSTSLYSLRYSYPGTS